MNGQGRGRWPEERWSSGRWRTRPCATECDPSLRRRRASKWSRRSKVKNSRHFGGTMPHYEFSEGTSNKFWEITLKGADIITTYGRIGTAGQSTTKSFKSDALAQAAYDKLIDEK